MPDHDPLKTAKAQLRREIRAQLAETEVAQLIAADLAILRRLEQSATFHNAHTILAYASTAREVNTWPLLARILAQGKRLCLPRISGPGLMEARQIQSLAELSADAYGIAAPPAQAPLIAPAELNLVIVPGLAFDRALWRLGQGGGYYDRYLANCPALRLALAREQQILPALPHGAHDLRMDLLVSEHGLLDCSE